jgi:hypothetical protein
MHVLFVQLNTFKKSVAFEYLAFTANQTANQRHIHTIYMLKYESIELFTALQCTVVRLRLKRFGLHLEELSLSYLVVTCDFRAFTIASGTMSIATG